MSGPKILLLDIETSLLLVETFSIYSTYIAPDDIVEDWKLYSFAAKWLGESKIHYADMRAGISDRNEKAVVKKIRDLIDEADVILTQNGKHFDEPRLNAKFAQFDLPRPSPHKHLDTKVIAKHALGFTSVSLEHMAKTLKLKHQKLKHKKFPGKELWREARKGNLEAWREMETYNKHDVLVLEDLYNKIRPYATNINLSVYYSDTACNCGSKDLERRGYSYTGSGKYQRYQCRQCRTWHRDKVNLLSANDRKKILVKA